MSKHTPETILRCDHCGLDVTDLYADVAFAHSHSDDPARCLLLCKKRHCNIKFNSMGSHPLAVFADRETGLKFLAGATLYARLDVEGWQRWIQITWAAAAVASPEQRKAGREQGEALDSIG